MKKGKQRISLTNSFTTRRHVRHHTHVDSLKQPAKHSHLSKNASYVHVVLRVESDLNKVMEWHSCGCLHVVWSYRNRKLRILRRRFYEKNEKQHRILPTQKTFRISTRIRDYSLLDTLDYRNILYTYIACVAWINYIILLTLPHNQPRLYTWRSQYLKY